MKQIMINSDCIACGGCFSESSFFKEDESGYAKIADSDLIDDEDFKEEVEIIVASCPVNAIEVTDVAENAYNEDVYEDAHHEDEYAQDEEIDDQIEETHYEPENTRHEAEKIRHEVEGLNPLEVVPSQEADTPKVDTGNPPTSKKRFSLLKIFGNLDLDEIDEPNMVSSQTLTIIKNKESGTYKKLERKVRDKIEEVIGDDRDYVEMNRDNFYIECHMDLKNHRLKMDKEKLSYYFDVSDDALAIAVSENSFEVSVNKAVLVKVFLLTAIYRKYGENINKLSYNDIVLCANDLIKKDFETDNEPKSSALTIVLGATLASIAVEASVYVALEVAIDAAENAARKATSYGERYANDAVSDEKNKALEIVAYMTSEPARESAFKSARDIALSITIKAAKESTLNTILDPDVDPVFNTSLDIAFNSAFDIAMESANKIATFEKLKSESATYMNNNDVYTAFRVAAPYVARDAALEIAKDTINRVSISDDTIKSASKMLKKMGYSKARETTNKATFNASFYVAREKARDVAFESARLAALKANNYVS